MKKGTKIILGIAGIITVIGVVVAIKRKKGSSTTMDVSKASASGPSIAIQTGHESQKPGISMWVKVTENKTDTAPKFDSIKVGDKVVLENGNQFNGETATVMLKETNPTIGKLLYLGDIDYKGIMVNATLTKI